MRDKIILELRPSLNLEVNDSIELIVFQNRTLRPILKLQHPLTQILLKATPHYAKIIEAAENPSNFSIAIRNQMKDPIFRNKILGVILGMMTIEEFKFYAQNSSEVNKRIISMQIQRYIDSIQ